MERTYHFTKRRLMLFAEVLDVLDRENVGTTDGDVRANEMVCEGCGETPDLSDALAPGFPLGA
jgi:hypothetical protein